jgi:HK97 family phage major capsid protein
MEVTTDQLEQLVERASAKGAEAAFKQLNTVAADQRPAAPDAPNVNRKRYSPPSLGKAMKAAFRGNWKGAEFEQDLIQAATKMFGGSIDDGSPAGYRSFVWTKSAREYVDVLYEMGETSTATDRVDLAIRAMAEDQTVTVTAGASTGSVLVPPQFLQDQFEYALTSPIALMNVPGVERIPVNSNLVYLPRESTPASAQTQTEAGALTTQDATFSQQAFTIPKFYDYSLFSNELLRDSTPAFMEYLARAQVRNVGLKMDIAFLESSSSPTGILSYSGLTTGPSLGADGRSPKFEDFMQAQYLLRVNNAEADFVISHPRVLNSLQTIKDATGNFLMSNIGGYGAPKTYGAGLAGSPPKALLIGALGMYFSSQMSIARTVGASTDCTTAIVGQAQYVKILERQGIEIAVSDQVAFANDQGAVRAIARATVAITQPKAVTLVSGVRP